MGRNEAHLRQASVVLCRDMNRDGSNQGTSGNNSARWASAC